MAAPIILADGVAPPPLGAKANGKKTSGAAVALTLSNPTKFGSVHWSCDANPGCTGVFSGGGADPVYPFSTTLTITGIGTYRVKAVGDLNAAGDEITTATLWVATLGRGLRSAVVGETTEYDTAAEWHDVIDAVVKGLDIVGGASTAVAESAGGGVAPNAALGSIWQVAVADNTAFTISNPTNAQFTGQEITFLIKNNVGGAMGAITWDTAFYLAGAFTNPADTKTRAITFIYIGGGKWYEKSRTAADA